LCIVLMALLLLLLNLISHPVLNLSSFTPCPFINTRQAIYLRDKFISISSIFLWYVDLSILNDVPILNAVCYSFGTAEDLHVWSTLRACSGAVAGTVITEVKHDRSVKLITDTLILKQTRKRTLRVTAL
jgi:hypothetical protein